MVIGQIGVRTGIVVSPVDLDHKQEAENVIRLYLLMVAQLVLAMRHKLMVVKELHVLVIRPFKLAVYILCLI